ncbi:MAG: hypothetical protein ACOCVF_02295 [bacterium]
MEKKTISELEKEYNNVLNKKFNLEHHFYKRMSEIIKNHKQDFLDNLKGVRLLHNHKVDKIDSSGIYLKKLSDNSIVAYPKARNLNILDVITLLKEVERLIMIDSNKRQLDLFEN